jgi:hypothetical protein
MDDVVSHLISKIEEDPKPKAPKNSFSIIGKMPKILRNKRFRNESEIKKLPKEEWSKLASFTLTDHVGRTWFPTKEQAINSAIIALSEREWLIDVDIIENL